jgi:hypothetical protein
METPNRSGSNRQPDEVASTFFSLDPPLFPNPYRTAAGVCYIPKVYTTRR